MTIVLSVPALVAAVGLILFAAAPGKWSTGGLVAFGSGLTALLIHLR
jgi:ABC-type Fe3+ transport system permease subunit